jgi:hypothetical protein
VIERRRLLPRFYAYTEEVERLRRLERVLREANAAEQPQTVARATLGGDQRRLRGTPIIARGARGALPGTDPVSELLRKEARRERRLR